MPNYLPRASVLIFRVRVRLLLLLFVTVPVLYFLFYVNIYINHTLARLLGQ